MVTTAAWLVASPVSIDVPPFVPLESWIPVWFPEGEGVGLGVELDWVWVGEAEGLGELEEEEVLGSGVGLGVGVEEGSGVLSELGSFELSGEADGAGVGSP